MIQRIRKGTWKAKPNASRLRYVRKGKAWRVRFRLVTNELEFKEWGMMPVPVKDTHIKLFGLYWSGWKVWARMREAWKQSIETQEKANEAFRNALLPPLDINHWMALRAALRQIPAWTHGNSVRVLARWETRDNQHLTDAMAYATGTAGFPDPLPRRARGVSLTAPYVYLKGKGAVTTGSTFQNKELCWLPEDPDNPGWTVWGTVRMWAGENWRLEGWGKVYVQGSDFGVSVEIPRRPWFFGLCMAHARNGPGKRVAPCDLEWEVEEVEI